MMQWAFQGHSTGCFKCNGFHVCSSFVHWNHQCYFCATCDIYWKICFLQRKSCRDVFSSTICFWTGLSWLLSYILVFLPISKLTILVHKIAIFFFCNFVFTHFLHIFSPLNCLSQVVIELPYVFFQTLIYGSLFYSMSSFEWTVMKFVWYIFFMFFTLLYFTYFGMMVTAMTPNHNVAPILAAPFYMMWNLFCGFMIPHKVMSHSVFSISIGYAI